MTDSVKTNPPHQDDSKSFVLEDFYKGLLRHFAKSYLENLTDGIYFDSDQKEESIELKFLRPNMEMISEIPDLEFMTLFEATILISQRTSDDNWSFFSEAMWVFADAIIEARLIPRDPISLIRYIDLPSNRASKFPDFNWCISREELYRFAKRLWPGHLFSDFHNEDQPTLTISTDQPQHVSIPHTSTIIIATNRQKLLKTLNREPSAEEVWNHLIESVGLPESGVADFDDELDTPDSRAGKPGKIGFDNVNGGLKYLTFKSIQNQLSQIRRKDRSNPE